MISVFFALVILAILFVIFWSVRSDRLPPDQASGPFAMRRPRPEPEAWKPIKRTTDGH